MIMICTYRNIIVWSYGLLRYHQPRPSAKQQEIKDKIAAAVAAAYKRNGKIEKPEKSRVAQIFRGISYTELWLINWCMCSRPICVRPTVPT